MDPSSLASVLGQLAQRAKRQTQLQQAQNEVLVELARSLATDREAMRELLGSGERGGETRLRQHIKMTSDSTNATMVLSRSLLNKQTPQRGQSLLFPCIA